VLPPSLLCQKRYCGVTATPDTLKVGVGVIVTAIPRLIGEIGVVARVRAVTDLYVALIAVAVVDAEDPNAFIAVTRYPYVVLGSTFVSV
jgi:hypothetical protein